MRTQIVNYLNKLGKESGLQSFEQAKNVYIEEASFQMRGIVTNTMKVQRHEAKKYYMEEVHKMYKEGMLKIEKK